MVKTINTKIIAALGLGVVSEELKAVFCCVDVFLG
jgi:hypothetical protein